MRSHRHVPGAGGLQPTLNNGTGHCATVWKADVEIFAAPVRSPRSDLILSIIVCDQLLLAVLKLYRSFPSHLISARDIRELLLMNVEEQPSISTRKYHFSNYIIASKDEKSPTPLFIIMCQNFSGFNPLFNNRNFTICSISEMPPPPHPAEGSNPIITNGLQVSKDTKPHY